MRKVVCLACPGDVCSTVGSRSGARFSVGLEQWECLEVSLRSIFFSRTFLFSSIGIESHTRVETNVMEITDIYTADTKVILAEYLSR